MARAKRRRNANIRKEVKRLSMAWKKPLLRWARYYFYKNHNCFESPIHCFKRADLIPLPLFLKPLHHQTKVWFSQQFPKCGLVFLIIVSGSYLFFSKQPFSEFQNINSLNRNNVAEKKRFSLIPEEMANYVYYDIFIYIWMLMKLFPVIVDCDLFPALKCDTTTYMFQGIDFCFRVLPMLVGQNFWM